MTSNRSVVRPRLDAPDPSSPGRSWMGVLVRHSSEGVGEDGKEEVEGLMTRSLENKFSALLWERF